MTTWWRMREMFWDNILANKIIGPFTVDDTRRELLQDFVRGIFDWQQSQPRSFKLKSIIIQRNALSQFQKLTIAHLVKIHLKKVTKLLHLSTHDEENRDICAIYILEKHFAHRQKRSDTLILVRL